MNVLCWFEYRKPFVRVQTNVEYYSAFEIPLPPLANCWSLYHIWMPLLWQEQQWLLVCAQAKTKTRTHTKKQPTKHKRFEDDRTKSEQTTQKNQTLIDLNQKSLFEKEWILSHLLKEEKSVPCFHWNPLMMTFCSCYSLWFVALSSSALFFAFEVISDKIQTTITMVKAAPRKWKNWRQKAYATVRVSSEEKFVVRPNIFLPIFVF